MPSQTEQVAEMLRQGPVCSYADVPLWMPNFRSRVSDLKAKGWVIEGRWCRREHEPKRGAHKEYVWQPPPVVYPYTYSAGHASE